MPSFSRNKIPSNNRPANERASRSTQQPQLICTWSAHALQSGSSPSPLPRSYHTLTATANATGELFLFGGFAHGSANSDVYVFSTRDFSTTLLQTSGEIPARYLHGAALIGNTLLICGGTSNGHTSLKHDSLDHLNLGTRKWSRVIVNGPGPGGRNSFTTNVVGSKLFIFGGRSLSSQKAFNDMWALELNSLKSQLVWEYYGAALGKKPLPRWGHISVTTGDHIIIFGGMDNRHCHNDTWSFDISTRKWTELRCTGSIPSPRAFHDAVSVDDVMYVYGGSTGKTQMDGLFALQLSTQQWFKFHNVGQSPSIRFGHAMASDGTHVFVLGGTLDAQADNIYFFDTRDIEYPEPERNAVKPNEKTTQLPPKSSTGPSTQEQLQHPTSSSSDAHDTSRVQKASPAVLGRPASPQITRERNPDPNGRPLEGTVVRDPEDGVIGGSAKYHVDFSAPDSSSEGEVTRWELGQQLSVSVSVQTERDEELVDVRARLRDMQAQLNDLLLSRGQHIVQHERELAGVRAKLEVNESELEAVRLRLADAEKDLTSLDELVASRDQQVGQLGKELTDMRAKLETKESELEAVRLRLADTEKNWTSLDELVVSHDQQVGQLGKELTDMRAKLEAKESELEAVRLRLTDAENLLTKGNAEADKFCAQYTTDSKNTDEDQVTRGLMERMEAIEDEIARGSKRWNEKSIEEMVCRNEG